MNMILTQMLLLYMKQAQAQQFQFQVLRKEINALGLQIVTGITELWQQVEKIVFLCDIMMIICFMEEICIGFQI